jgi:hypothetical protein
MGVACRNGRRVDVWCSWKFGLNVCREDIMIDSFPIRVSDCFCHRFPFG